MPRRKVTDAQILVCQQAGLCVTEAARVLEVSPACISKRARQMELSFVDKSGQRLGGYAPPSECCSCNDRKLCLLCHRLHVLPLPCERELRIHGHGELRALPVEELEGLLERFYG